MWPISTVRAFRRALAQGGPLASAKAELQKRGLNTSGLKAELQQRLEEAMKANENAKKKSKK